MLFGKKKYNYLSILILYFKIVPGVVIIKIINNLIGSLLPTFSIIITAKFLDTALAVVGNRNKLSEIVFPLCAIIAIQLFNYYAGIIINLINIRAGNKIRKTAAPVIAEKKASVKFKYLEHQESADIINRATVNFEINLQGFFDQIFNAWNAIMVGVNRFCCNLYTVFHNIV